MDRSIGIGGIVVDKPKSNDGIFRSGASIHMSFQIYLLVQIPLATDTLGSGE